MSYSWTSSIFLFPHLLRLAFLLSLKFWWQRGVQSYRFKRCKLIIDDTTIRVKAQSWNLSCIHVNGSGWEVGTFFWMLSIAKILLKSEFSFSIDQERKNVTVTLLHKILEAKKSVIENFQHQTEYYRRWYKILKLWILGFFWSTIYYKSYTCIEQPR
jgi:hypothetical protein